MKFDLHLHSCYSTDGFDPPKNFFKVARVKKIDGFSITDHDSIEGSKKAYAMSKDFENIIVLRAVEISTIDGHILAYGVTELIPKKLSLEETIDKIHDLGGIAIAAHPFDFLRVCVGKQVIDTKIDGLEVINGRTAIGNGKAKKIAKENSFLVTAGSDAHLAKNIGSCYIECDANTEDELIYAIKKKTVSVHGKGTLRSLVFEAIDKRFKKLFGKKSHD